MVCAEGKSINAICRVFGAAKNTALKLLIDVVRMFVAGKIFLDEVR